MRIYMETRIELDDERKARAIIASLEPDNIGVPEGISLEVLQDQSEVVVRLICESERILTCRSTLDEILMLIDKTRKVLFEDLQ
ncbi:MAG: KEOPS complex subunit Pcc1 [Sulfolobales archaeon]